MLAPTRRASRPRRARARRRTVLSLQALATRLLLRLPRGLLVRMAGGSPTVIDGRTLDPALQLVAANARRQRGGRPLPGPVEARRSTNAGMALLSGTPRPLAAIEPIAIPGPGGKLAARLYRPHALAEGAPLLLYFHQGGFVIGTVDWCEAFCSLLADEAGCLVLSVDYRLAPEHPFPAATEDALATWRFVQEEGARLGADPARVAVGGESAGGNLAAVLCQETRGSGDTAPLLQLLLFPWLEGRARTPSRETFAGAWPLDAELMDWFTDHALADPADLDHPRLNPLHAGDLTGLAPALIFTAGFDPLADEGRQYADKLNAAGVLATHHCFDALTHSFTAMGAVPSCLAAQKRIARALEQALT